MGERTRRKVTPRPWRSNTDPVRAATLSGDLNQMLSVIERPAHGAVRHFLYASIEEIAFKQRRSDPAMQELLVQTCRRHIQEMPTLAPDLLEAYPVNGRLPRIAAYEYLAGELLEGGQLDAAQNICELGIALDSVGTAPGLVKVLRRIEEARSDSGPSSPPDVDKSGG